MKENKFFTHLASLRPWSLACPSRSSRPLTWAYCWCLQRFRLESRSFKCSYLCRRSFPRSYSLPSRWSGLCTCFWVTVLLGRTSFGWFWSCAASSVGLRLGLFRCFPLSGRTFSKGLARLAGWGSARMRACSWGRSRAWIWWQLPFPGWSGRVFSGIYPW